jgi:PHD/YefM family antitoxin component YafN of YafNO toxin-antitoxin module
MDARALTRYQYNDIFYTEKHLEDKLMPAIRKSADLRNNYGEISEFCHNFREPIFITKNGQGDLAVMSIETYEELMGKLELYQAIEAGLNQIENGETITEEEMIEHIKNL